MVVGSKTKKIRKFLALVEFPNECDGQNERVTEVVVGGNVPIGVDHDQAPSEKFVD